MAGARDLWRATGMKNEDFGKPIIAVINSFKQFVPGDVHLKDIGAARCADIEQAGGVEIGAKVQAEKGAEAATKVVSAILQRGFVALLHLL